MATANIESPRVWLADLEARYPWRSMLVDGQEWRWLDTARPGPAAVLLPGSVGDGAMFGRILLSLGERVRLVAVTYPALSEPGALAAGLAAVMDRLQVPRATVAGSSFAAYWIQFFALAYPQRVRALVIGNGFTDSSDLADNPLFDRGYVESVDAATLHAEWLRRVRAMPSSPLQALQEIMLAERQSPENLRARFLGVVRARACPPLPLAAEAITVLDCDDDPLIPPPARARLRAAYSAARHVSLPHGGHYPHLLNPGEYEKLVLGTLS
ncbi:MAG: alpha/beta hydrolase [Pigmentiphaga sp.]|uniref:alpha/beta fold hydrolase n=1 Tax=Pigmentiphaga sp. TaxID=1977564 RepID=UPI0029A21E4B|nr:alpha/beta hydrolase [Pigmentiphaga sp.]MDX3906173.1 alpha/beta hydrolase [Pigmentiphaga sp.]